MRVELPGGYELDDDRARVDRAAVHAYIGGESYWAKGRSREVMDALIDNAARVVGLYRRFGFTEPSERVMERPRSEG